MLAALLLASTPAFEPIRDHAWGEHIETAFAIESEQTDSDPAHMLTPAAEYLDANRAPFLHYTFNTAVPFEFVALNFESSRLTRLLYPLHLPSSDQYTEKPATDVPEKFQSVRAWLTEHLGEPDVFTTSITGYSPDFADVESLLEIDAYTFNYTWCSHAANAYLIALRETGSDPVVFATLTPPERLSQAENGAHVCESPGERLQQPIKKAVMQSPP